MSDHEQGRGPTRRVVIGLALSALIARDEPVAAAEDEVFSERFVTFEPPEPLPSLVLLDRKNLAATFAPRPDRATLIALWANWCPACRRDIPRLAAAAQSLAKEGIDVVLVNVDAEPFSGVFTRSADRSIGNVPLFFDPEGHRLAVPSSNGRRSPFQQFGMPILFVIDRGEHVRGYVKGSIDWTSPEVRTFFHTFAEA